MQIFRRVLGAALAFCAALALLTLLTDAMAGSAELMLALMERCAPPEETGLAAKDYASAAEMIAGYLSGETETFALAAAINGTEAENVFNEKEQAHMADVRALFVLDRAAALASVLFSVLLLLGLRFTARPGLAGLRGLRGGLRALLLLLAALLVWGAVDFDSLFVLFHRAAFANTLWLLDPQTDLLIRLMPTDFFVAYASLIAAAWLVPLCLAALAAERALRRADPRRRRMIF